ncbi:MAG: hypothetical protein JWL85_19 [Candidatus Saccharibacteria bacterium]|nr:hypothetical protein [Candidatus Saccharibacteria bacterium]
MLGMIIQPTIPRDASAEVITYVALHPCETSRANLPERIGIDRESVSLALQNLIDQREWISDEGSITHRNSRRLRATGAFWNTFHRVLDDATDTLYMNNRYWQIYTDTVTECRGLAALPEEGIEETRDHAFLGGIALLGTRYDLSTISKGEWFKGAAGWKALITIEALKD